MNRTDALKALVQIDDSIPEAISRVSNWPWDSKSELVLLASEHFRHVLSLFTQGKLSAAEVENWANALESRDDVGFSTPLTHELLHELANPSLTQPLSTERVNFWLAKLPNGR